MKEIKEEIKRKYYKHRNNGKFGWTNLIVKIIIFIFLAYSIYNFINVNDFDLKEFFNKTKYNNNR